MLLEICIYDGQRLVCVYLYVYVCVCVCNFCSCRKKLQDWACSPFIHFESFSYYAPCKSRYCCCRTCGDPSHFVRVCIITCTPWFCSSQNVICALVRVCKMTCLGAFLLLPLWWLTLLHNCITVYCCPRVQHIVSDHMNFTKYMYLLSPGSWMCVNKLVYIYSTCACTLFPAHKCFICTCACTQFPAHKCFIVQLKCLKNKSGCSGCIGGGGCNLSGKLSNNAQTLTWHWEGISKLTYAMRQTSVFYCAVVWNDCTLQKAGQLLLICPGTFRMQHGHHHPGWSRCHAIEIHLRCYCYHC